MRRIGRQTAFHLVFSAACRLDEFALGLTEELARYYEVYGRPDEDTMAFTEHLVRGVIREWSTLDGAVTGAKSHWSLKRIGLVEKSIMRIAVFELSHPDHHGVLTPTEIVIDEAVELAKIYGADEAPAFVNGVLDAVAAARRPASAGQATT